MNKSDWIEEKWDSCGFAARYEVTNRLDHETTPFQQLELVETKLYGRMLLLDGFVQTTEREEFVYHEMMVHVPMLAHGAAERVLIIGGGDGGILREVVRYGTVKRIVQVEIDRRVIDFCRQVLPTLSDGAFDDPRLELVIADGAAYAKTAEEKFDVIIVDSCDPVGPAEVLFQRDFYANLRGCLAKGGLLTQQTGSSILQPNELPQAAGFAREFFPFATGYTYAAPGYLPGLFTSLIAGDLDPTVIDLEALATSLRFSGGKDTLLYPGGPLRSPATSALY